MHTLTIIELDRKLSKEEEKKVKALLADLLSINPKTHMQIYDSKEYPFESEYATDVATKIWALKALESVDWRK
jgi:hypothetical protein